MKKAFFLLLSVVILAAYYICGSIYHKDKTGFISPTEQSVLRLRHDAYGDGRFGAKRKNGRLHTGADILMPAGSTVRAAKAGWAVSKFDKDGYGNYVVIYHGAGYATYYAHLEASAMRWIKRVKKGDVIGWAGKTGNARYDGIKPHLHFEIRKDGVALDPLKTLQQSIAATEGTTRDILK